MPQRNEQYVAWVTCKGSCINTYRQKNTHLLFEFTVLQYLVEDAHFFSETTRQKTSIYSVLNLRSRMENLRESIHIASILKYHFRAYMKFNYSMHSRTWLNIINFTFYTSGNRNDSKGYPNVRVDVSKESRVALLSSPTAA